MNGTGKDREHMRQEIATYSRKLMLSGGVVELCAAEATPRQAQFLHRVLLVRAGSRSGLHVGFRVPILQVVPFNCPLRQWSLSCFCY